MEIKQVYNSHKSLIWSVGVVVIIVFLCVFSKSAQSGQKYSKKLVSNVRYVVGEAARLQSSAAQNSNPLMSLIDITTAIGLMKGLRRSFSSAEVARLSNTNPEDFINTLEEEQQKSIKKVMTVCPAVTPDTPHVDKTGWIG